MVTGRSALGELSEVQHSGGSGHVASAGVAVAVVASAVDPSDASLLRRLYFDLGQAVMSMMIAAAGLRIASGHAGVFDQDLARKVLGLPSGKFCAFVIAFGYPADRPLDLIRRPARRPFDEVVHREHW